MPSPRQPYLNRAVTIPAQDFKVLNGCAEGMGKADANSSGWTKKMLRYAEQTAAKGRV
jgi:hypothetical protein